MKKILFLSLFFFSIYNIKAMDLYVSKRDIDSFSYVDDCDFLFFNEDSVLLDSWVASSDTHVISNVSSGSYVLVERPLVDDSFDDSLSVFHEIDVHDSSLSVVLYNSKIDTPINLGSDYGYFFIGCSILFLGIFFLYVGYSKFSFF